MLLALESVQGDLEPGDPALTLGSSAAITD